MVDVPTTSPQLKLTKDLLDAYFTRDLKKVEPFLSNDYKYTTYPSVDHHPDQSKAEHVQFWGAKFASFHRVEPTIYEVIEGSGKVVVHLDAAWIACDGVAHTYPSVLIIYFVLEDGLLKVQGMKHFTEPEKRANYHEVSDKAVAANPALSVV